MGVRQTDRDREKERERQTESQNYAIFNLLPAQNETSNHLQLTTFSPLHFAIHTTGEV